MLCLNLSFASTPGDGDEGVVVVEFAWAGAWLLARDEDDDDLRLNSAGKLNDRLAVADDGGGATLFRSVAPRVVVADLCGSRATAVVVVVGGRPNPIALESARARPTSK